MKNKQNEYKNRITDTNHITMTPFLSQKIKLLSLISIILVLYIHSGFHDYPNEIQGMPFNFKLQDFISGKIRTVCSTLILCYKWISILP